MAAAQLQHWTLLLAAYDYDIQYRDVVHHCYVDGLSQLSLPTASQVKLAMVELLQVKHLEALPVLYADVCKETRDNHNLSQVMEMMALDIFSHLTDVLVLYVNRKDELTMQQGCYMRGWRVVIPPKLRSRGLAELNTGQLHIVVSCIDTQVEQLSKNYQSCQQTLKSLRPSTSHPWKWPESPWQCIHADFIIIDL